MIFFFLVTFEDKRKLNFDKGQAELERRRQMLQDQMRAENNARLEKERQEQEKRERIRFVSWAFLEIDRIKNPGGRGGWLFMRLCF